MKIGYLDQNKWIELARARTRKVNEPELEDLYVLMKGALERKLARFPLSLGHYIETHQNANPERRKRLAAVMNDLSEGITLCGVGQILRYEIDCALFEYFPHLIRPDKMLRLELLGSGIQHASGYPFIPRYRLPTEYANRADQQTVNRMEAIVNTLIQESFLSGVMPFGGEERARSDLSAPSKNFMAHLDQLYERLSPLDQELRQRTLHAMSMVDIMDPLGERMAHHGILWHELGRLGPDGLCKFVSSMPTRRVDVQLHSQWAKNRSLRSKLSDLTDWGYLGFASMYCDVLVTEKQFADLVRRDGFRPRARVLTDLRELPDVLVTLN